MIVMSFVHYDYSEKDTIIMTIQEKKIGIIGGNGKMGTFFKKFFTRYGYNVSSWDNTSHLALEKFLEPLDIILISVPIDATQKVIESLYPFLQDHQCISDVTSLKQFPMEAMEKAPKGKFFGMHPMFAPPISGKIEGQNIIFCSGNAPEEEKIFQDIFKDAGAFCIDLDADEHDKIMSLIQGLSHFLDLTFIKTLEKSGIDVDKIFGSRSPAYAIKMMLAGRTIAQDANLYGNIQMQNPRNIDTLEKFLDISNTLLQVVKEKNLPEYEKIFNEGKNFLDSYAQKSQHESDLLIDFLARRILKSSQYYESQEEELQIPQKHCIGILGPKQTFSHIAAKKFFGENEDFHLFPSIPAIFSALKKKEISEAFVPIENLLHGSVAESIDGIVNARVPIKAVYEMKITPALFASKQTQREKITAIYSHPQALAQCSQFLEKNFPNARYIPTHSTTNAIKKVIHDNHSAAIAAPEMMESYNVTVLEKNIANIARNATRFTLLSHKEYDYSSPLQEGAFLFSLNKDCPGGLEKMLHAFSVRNINLTKIESRPTGEAFGEYIFFVTYSGRIADSEKEIFRKEIAPLVIFARFIGEYGIFSSQNPYENGYTD